MKEWYKISPENSYVTENYYLHNRQYFCQKCGHFLGGDLFDLVIESMHDEIAIICEIGKIIVKEKGKDILEKICPAEVEIQAIKKERHYLVDVLPVAEIFKEKIEYYKEPCDFCGTYRGVSCGKAFFDPDVSIFSLMKRRPDTKYKICRTPIQFGDSNMANYIVFVDEELKEELERLNCKNLDFAKCVDMID